jgi:hypothetical protein
VRAMSKREMGATTAQWGDNNSNDTTRIYEITSKTMNNNERMLQ